jgi:glycosyltransferase involved in cell wall biosynthesis
MPSRSLKLGAILPHTKLFGGIRRFFELGTIFIKRSHQFTIFTVDGEPPDWFTFEGKVEKISNISKYELDALFLTEAQFLPALFAANAKIKVLYHVGPRTKLNDVVRRKDITVFANSTNMFELDRRKYGIEAVKAYGGVHLPPTFKTYSPSQPIHIMAYGRLTRKGKGTALVVKACEKLHRKGYNIKLLLFDTPIDQKSSDKIEQFTCKVPFEFIVNHPVSKNHELFSRADIFVAAEKKGGWSNTAAEALAAGVALVATKTGTNDFLVHNETGLKVWRHPYFIRRALEKIINDPALGKRLSENGRKKIEELSWERLADTIEHYVASRV